jgi:hypothetical protein
MNESLLVAGIVCIVAAIVGGGVKLLGAEVPVLNSFARQALLFTVGLAFLAASYLTSLPKISSGAKPKAACSATTGLACLPLSSRPVVFADAEAANLAAYDNIRSAVSTSEGAAQAMAAGASGNAARLCGILTSNDSSPLGKHLAALRLLANNPAEGQATPNCMSLASDFR